MELVPDVETVLWSYLTLEDLGRVNVVYKGTLVHFLTKRWRRKCKERAAKKVWSARHIPRNCCVSSCDRRTAEYINVLRSSPPKRLHYCGECLIAIFLDRAAPLYEKYISIMDMTIA